MARQRGGPGRATNDNETLPSLTEITTQQERVIELLLVGKTHREAAEEVGVHRVTVTKWANRHPAFRAEMNARRRQVWAASVDRLRALVPKAVQCIENELDTGGPNAVRAALKVLELSKLAELGRLDQTGPADTPSVIRGMASDEQDAELFSGGLVSEYRVAQLVDELEAEFFG